MKQNNISWNNRYSLGKLQRLNVIKGLPNFQYWDIISGFQNIMVGVYKEWYLHSRSESEPICFKN